LVGTANAAPTHSIVVIITALARTTATLIVKENTAQILPSTVS
jgi:hypothetical protein